MISNLMGGYDRAGLLSMLPGLPVPFAVMIAGYLVAMGVAALLRVKKERRGTFQSMFALSNTVFIGCRSTSSSLACEPALRASVYFATDAVWTLVCTELQSTARRNGSRKPSLSRVGSQGDSFAAPPGISCRVILILLGVHSEVDHGYSRYWETDDALSMLFIGL